MEKGFTFISAPSQCAYLKDKMWSLEHWFVPRMDRDEYLYYLQTGWRRFGAMMFRPRCAGCNACLSLRVLVDQFRPDRSQKRTKKANEDTKLVVGKPDVDATRLELYYRHHMVRFEKRGWRKPKLDNAIQLIFSLTESPIPAEEWSYYIDGKLVGVSYVDVLSEGYSAIYSFHDPDYHKRSLGTWMVLSMIEEARKKQMPYVYLGYYVQHCISLEYKARFAPNEVLGSDGKWSTFVA